MFSGGPLGVDKLGEPVVQVVWDSDLHLIADRDDSASALSLGSVRVGTRQGPRRSLTDNEQHRQGESSPPPSAS